LRLNRSGFFTIDAVLVHPGQKMLAPHARGGGLAQPWQSRALLPREGEERYYETRERS
jgi:hypothetical protein